MKLAAVILLAAIAAPAQESAKVNIYCPKYVMVAKRIPLECNGVLVAELEKGRYLTLVLRPGTHSFKAIKNAPATELALVAGDVRYLRCGVPAHRIFYNGKRPQFLEVTAMQGEHDLKGVPYITPEKIKDKAVLPASADLLRK